jgi:hypothetical protein
MISSTAKEYERGRRVVYVERGGPQRPPERPLCWRRASTFCKAPLKKSSSMVLSTNTRLSWYTFRRSVACADSPVTGSVVS